MHGRRPLLRRGHARGFPQPWVLLPAHEDFLRCPGLPYFWVEETLPAFLRWTGSILCVEQAFVNELTFFTAMKRNYAYTLPATRRGGCGACRGVRGQDGNRNRSSGSVCPAPKKG